MQEETYKFTPGDETGEGQRPVLLVNKQLVKIPGQIIRVFDRHNRLVAKAHSLPFKLKEKLNIYTDEERRSVIAHAEAVKIMDFNAAFVITSANKQHLGSLRRRGLVSELGRDTWHIYDAKGKEVAKLQEPNLKFSIIRKWLLPFLPQTYHLFLVKKPEVNLVIKQTWTPVILRYKVYSNSYAVFTKTIPQKLLISILCTVASIEGRE